MVEVEQPAEPRPPSHPGRWPHRRWRAAQQLVLKTLMVPLPVVVLDILVDKLSEVSLTQRHDSAETFLFDGANEPLDIGIEIGTARWKTHGADAAAPENLLEVIGVQRVAVVKQIRDVRRKPSPGSVRLRAICSIHAPSGCGWMPTT